MLKVYKKLVQGCSSPSSYIHSIGHCLYSSTPSDFSKQLPTLCLVALTTSHSRINMTCSYVIDSTYLVQPIVSTRLLPLSRNLTPQTTNHIHPHILQTADKYIVMTSISLLPSPSNLQLPSDQRPFQASPQLAAPAARSPVLSCKSQLPRPLSPPLHPVRRAQRRRRQPHCPISWKLRRASRSPMFIGIRLEVQGFAKIVRRRVCSSVSGRRTRHLRAVGQVIFVLCAD